MSAFNSTKPSPLQQDQDSPPDRVQIKASTLAPESEPAPKDKVAQAQSAEAETTADRPLTKTQVAAAATRARMMEFVGTRHRQGRSSSSIGTINSGPSRFKDDHKKNMGGGEQDLSQSKDVEIEDLLG
ncbi:hypothetical protein EK21DRAFT_84954 [Setomelanomma holmii]|uniref:Uncharacterized protein n=1 Tax=Setomelanomma holmii TaxID=210430 RepID=A0A9P4HIE3_9PLEO|nr:hypothetical protein EK21DRAFT_84954 [Setomelanomma holmii]